MKTISEITLIGILPKGNWKLAVLNDTVVAVCSQHEPRIVINNKLEILKPVSEPVFVDQT